MTSTLIIRNIVGQRGHRTTMRLEPEMWAALSEICQREKITMADLVCKVDGTRVAGGRTSAIRVFAFNYFRQAATDEGHRLAGHQGSDPPAPTSLQREQPMALTGLGWWRD